jgi:L-threonylcarbamoyladenylate synthase
VADVFDLQGPEGPALKAADEALSAGELVVFPTDTVYGVAASPDIPGATHRLFTAKRRSRGLTLPILAATVEDAAGVAVFDARARTLSAHFWPGGLTMILPRAPRANDWDLGDEHDTLGVRIPNHPVALGLLARTGPLAVTSANRSGEPTPPTCGGILASLGETAAVYLCAGSARGEIPSTVVDLTGPEPQVLREGAVPTEALLAALEGAG